MPQFRSENRQRTANVPQPSPREHKKERSARPGAGPSRALVRTLSVPIRCVHCMDSVEVEPVDGAPVSFVRDGRTWHVGAVPVRWYERLPWWETARRAPKGGDLRIDVVVWQVQARIGRNHRSPLVTF